MSEVLLLIAVMVLLVGLLGLPLLVKPESRIPDYIGCGLMAVIVLGYAWSASAWWVLLPVAGVIALVLWLDRRRIPDEPGVDGAGRDRAQQRFLYLRLANRIGFLICLGAVVIFGSGARLVPVDVIIGCLLTSLVATTAFRLSYNNAVRRGLT